MPALALPIRPRLILPRFEPWRIMRPLKMAIEGQFAPYQRLQFTDIDRRRAKYGGNDSSTKLLLHLDGANNSTTFTDSSASAHTITRGGSAKITTAQSVFGGASLVLNGSTDFLSAADSADWDFGTGDFTIDLRLRFNALPSTSAACLVAQYQSTTVGMALEFRNDGTGARIHFTWGNTTILDASWSPSTATWYHLAIARASGTIRAFVDGTQIGADTSDSTDLTGSTKELTIGYLHDYPDALSLFFLNGWIDELRVSKGVARWIANFIPPWEAYS